jgi:hypothetical protein
MSIGGRRGIPATSWNIQLNGFFCSRNTTFAAKGRLAGGGWVVSENAPLKNPSSKKIEPFKS